MLSPVRAGSVPPRSRTGIKGHVRFRGTAGRRPSSSSSWGDANGRSDCGPEGQRSAPSGSRWAATGVRNNRRVCLETVEDHDRRFWYRWRLTWCSSHAFTVLNTTQFHVRRLGADLARRKRGVQIPSPPPHNSPGHEPWRVASTGRHISPAGIRPFPRSARGMKGVSNPRWMDGIYRISVRRALGRRFT
jgi:hypothetical protein